MAKRTWDVALHARLRAEQEEMPLSRPECNASTPGNGISGSIHALDKTTTRRKSRVFLVVMMGPTSYQDTVEAKIKVRSGDREPGLGGRTEYRTGRSTQILAHTGAMILVEMEPCDKRRHLIGVSSGARNITYKGLILCLA
jgi:hypothetical protein